MKEGKGLVHSLLLVIIIILLIIVVSIQQYRMERLETDNIEIWKGMEIQMRYVIQNKKLGVDNLESIVTIYKNMCAMIKCEQDEPKHKNNKMIMKKFNQS